jgi:hypothetical protein
VIIATLMNDSATVAGLTAAAIAVCGFLAHAKSAIAGRDEAELRQLTVMGGLAGFVMSLFIVGCSAVV